TLPLGPEHGGLGLTPRALAVVFERHPSPGVPPGYAARLAALGFREVAGHLRGFVDLVFEHGGRFYLVDWKSNHLGPAPADYRLERLAETMAAHHYVLQAHLYAAAVDRYLRRRLPGYDYANHFGGVAYLFLRGIGRGGDGGVFSDKPPAALISDLARVLDAAAGEPTP
ncbi:MAG: PD-(D/E)XK nuclease family protein, partial [Candidatus Binatia bacterium]